MTGRRAFLKGAVAGGASVVASTPLRTLAQAPAAANNAAVARTADAPAGYQYFRPAEAAFVEALVDHMVPADNLSPGRCSINR